MTAPSAPRTGLRSPARLALLTTVMLGVMVAAGAYGTRISGAVIAPGEAVVRGKPKTVQSYDGGIAAEIRVADGDLVESGEVLIRLDPTLVRINLDILRNRLAEERVRAARLMSEQAGLETIAFDYDREHLEGIDLDRINRGQAEIFDARRAFLHGRKEQLVEQGHQILNRIQGVDALIDARTDQLGYVERELDNVRRLHSQGLARESQMMELQRARAGLLGEIAGQKAELAQLHNSFRDSEMEILQSERQFREQVVTDLREAVMGAEELVLQIVTARKQLERIEITAPVAGIVHEMRVSTVGGVVPVGETLLEIIPVSEGLDFEVRIEPKSIDQVFVGQSARVHFPAFGRDAAPDLAGRVTAVSPSTITDPMTRQGFYRVSLTLPPEELARLGDATLVPGMPVEAFLQQGERSLLSFLTRPMTAQFNRAFRED